MLTRLLAQEQAVLAAKKQSQHKYLPTGEEKTVVRNQGFVVQKIGAQVCFLSCEPVVVMVRVGSGTRMTFRQPETTSGTRFATAMTQPNLFIAPTTCPRKPFNQWGGEPSRTDRDHGNVFVLTVQRSAGIFCALQAPQVLLRISLVRALSLSRSRCKQAGVRAWGD